MDQVDESLIQRLAALSPGTQRWLKTALQSIVTMPSPTDTDDEAPPVRDIPSFLQSEVRDEAPPATPFSPPVQSSPPVNLDIEREPEREHPSPLEDVIAGKSKLDEQLETYPELADELEGIGDVIDMLRDLGESRRRRGEDILREDILGEGREDSDERDEIT